MDGNLLIHLSLISYSIGFFALIYSGYIKNNNIHSLGICSFLFGSSLIILSFFILIRGYIVSDLSLINVATNSNHFMPLHYRIAAVWGNHEGSMLLLVTYFAIVSVVFYKLSYKKSFAKYSLLVQISVNIILLLFIIHTSNPFIRVFPIPNIGLGLNPVLQDSGLVLHPPILYLGHASCFIIYSIGLGFCRHKKIEVMEIKPWIFFSLSCLTLGIGMGSWWAYKEIGWGGYWFWDPVENISLLPWLILSALLHSINRSKILYNASLFLSILAFVLLLLGIFIVRAGLLKSVHSFAQDSERGFILFSVFLIYTTYGCWELSNGIQSIKISKDKITQLISISNYLILGCIIIILIGIFYPLFSEITQGIAITINANFFNITFNSLMLFNLLLCILSTLDKNIRSYFPIFIISLIIVISTIVINHFNISYIDLLAVLGIILSSYIFIKTLIVNIYKQELSLYAIVSHCSFGLAILAISLSSLLSIDQQKFMSIGDSTVFAKFNITLTDIEHNIESNYIAKTAVMTIQSSNLEQHLFPALHIFPIEKQMTSESAIARHFLYDLHINITQVTDDGYLFTFYYRPFINWLWTAIVIISITTMIKAIEGFIKLKVNSRAIKQY